MKKLLVLILALICVLCFTSCNALYSSIDNLLYSPSLPEDSSSETEESTPEESTTESTQEESSNEESTQEQSTSEKKEPENDAPTGDAHVHSFATRVIPSSCLYQGYTYHLCECGYEFADSFTASVGSHNFERGICTVCDEINYPDLVNLVTTESMKSNVFVKVVYSNGMGSLAIEVGSTNGSGVIIQQTGTAVYILTNNHVVYNEELETSTRNTSIYVYDYLGNQYSASIIANRASYDLALLKITCTTQQSVIKLADSVPEKGDTVISLGSPEGQTNAITMGSFKGYESVTISEVKATESNVTFEVLHHNSYINHGSSGGALLNERLEIAGINYAGSFEETNAEPFSYAIPIDKVKHFLTTVGFEYIPPAEGEA